MFDGLRADSSLVDKPDGKPLHNGLTEFGKVHCKKKVSDIPVPSRDATYQTLPWRPFLRCTQLE